MELEAGYRLGPYEIVSQLGAGGMGEVFLAQDTRLGRNVAVKVLSRRSGDIPAHRERFDREARAISALNHAQICTLHDVGHHEGLDYLVMEHVEGRTLAERLVEGPLPIDDVFRYGLQIVEALDHAHRRGVVHRDLKPANIMLTDSGVKLLDYGLAKLRSIDKQTDTNDGALEVTKIYPLTEEGTIVGTVPYMAPEQLVGEAVDARTDVFAFGAVIYEMATGRAAFGGENKVSLIAAILDQQPPTLSDIQPTVHAGLEHVIDRCLMKDPDERWQTARDLGRELKWNAEQPVLNPLSTQTTAAKSRERAAWGLAAVLLVAAAMAVFARFDQRPTNSPAGVQFAVEAPQDGSFLIRPTGQFVSVSPDGSHVAMLVNKQGSATIWVRSLADIEAKPLTGTEDARSPFWSPDGRFIAFFADAKLKKIALRGGAPAALCDAPGLGLCGSWGEDGTILFSTIPTLSGIYRVPAAGGAPEPVVKRTDMPPGVIDYWPEFLPDGRHFLWLSLDAATRKSYLRVGSLDSSESQPLFQTDSRVEYVQPGYVMFVREGTLYAQPFDVAALQTTGEAQPIAQDVGHQSTTGAAFFSASDTGVLVYHGRRPPSRLKWRDRDGLEHGSLGGVQSYLDLRLGPDDQRVALSIYDDRFGTPDVWIYDLLREAPIRFTTNPAPDFAPLWSPDGNELVFSSAREGAPHMHLKPLSLDLGVEKLLDPSGTQAPTDWTADRRYIVYADSDVRGQRNLCLLPTGEKAAEPIRLSSGEFNTHSARLSPDERWLAFVSDESGRQEIYVQELSLARDGDQSASPQLVGEKHRISTAGGTQPRWGQTDAAIELFFVNADRLLTAVPVNADEGFELGEPKILFKVRSASTTTEETYDVTSDGQRFLVQESVGGPMSMRLTVEQNWMSALSDP